MITNVKSTFHCSANKLCFLSPFILLRAQSVISYIPLSSHTILTLLSISLENLKQSNFSVIATHILVFMSIHLLCFLSLHKDYSCFIPPYAKYVSPFHSFKYVTQKCSPLSSMPSLLYHQTFCYFFYLKNKVS